MLYDISSFYDTGTKYTLGAFNCDIIVQYNNYVYSSTLSLSSISLTAWITCKLIYFTLTCINVLYISTVCKFVPSWLLGILIHFFKLFENSNKIIVNNKISQTYQLRFYRLLRWGKQNNLKMAFFIGMLAYWHHIVAFNEWFVSGLNTFCVLCIENTNEHQNIRTSVPCSNVHLTSLSIFFVV